jgi:arylsulfatase A-like enzyme
LELRRHIATGIIIGFAAGIAEAAIVNRTGFFAALFTALVYALLTAAGFLLLALLGRAIRRGLVPFGVGASTTSFAFLEAGFWLSKRSPYRAGSPRGMALNAGVLLVAIAVGLWAGFAYRKHMRRTKPFRPAVAIVGAAVVILAAFFGVSYMASNPGPNFILISIDALRRDHLGCYGYERETSPNIDRLAAGGSIFLRAFTPSPGSTGGHASMLTGLYTLSHGAYMNGVKLPPEAPTAAEILKEWGYVTGAFTKNWYISPAVGFGQGFDCFIDNADGIILKKGSPGVFARGPALYQMVRRLFDRPEFPSMAETKDAISWMRFMHKQRFFLFIHMMDVHSPYIPAPAFAGRFGGVRPDHERIQSLHDKSWEVRLSEEEVDFLVDRYDEGILTADHKIGLLVRELEHLGIDDNTLVVLTADHGEVMDESAHKQFGHGTLDHGSLKIPLIMWWPGKIPAGTCRQGTVQSVDILPTTLALLGIEDGVSRQGEMLFESPDSVWLDRPAFATGDLLARDEYTVITPKWQYTLLGEEAQLLKIDESATAPRSLMMQYPSIADSLQSVLQAWIDRSLAEAVVPFSLEGRSVTPGKEALERLKALGYIQ